MATRLCSLQQNKQEKNEREYVRFSLYIGIFLNGIITFGNIGTFCAVGTKMCRIENYLFYVTIEKKFRKRRRSCETIQYTDRSNFRNYRGKWKVVILCHLTKGTKRTSELQRLIPEISVRMLTQQLRELEDDGVITREIYKEIPPRVEYSLTDYGWSLQNVLNQLTVWGERCIDRKNSKVK